MSGSPYYPLQVISPGTTLTNEGAFPRAGGLELESGATLVTPTIAGLNPSLSDPGQDGVYTGGYVFDYGVVISALVDDSWSSGGTTYTGDNGGLLVVEDGGVAEYTNDAPANLELGNGNVWVSSGGYAYDTTGRITVFAGGSASIVNGDETIAGGTVTSTYLNTGPGGFGENQVITSGGTAFETVLSAPYVSGYTFDDQIISNGIATNNTLIGNVAQFVYAGGSAVNNTLTNGAALYVSGGTVSDTTLGPGTTAAVTGGIVVSTSLGSGTNVVVAGGTLSDTHVSSGATIIVTGGTLINTTIQNGGEVLALPGATVEGTDVQTGGTLINGGVVTVLISAYQAELLGEPGGGFYTDVELDIPAPTIATGLDILAPRQSYMDFDPLEPTTYIWNGGSASGLTTDGHIIVANGGQISDVMDLGLGIVNEGGINPPNYTFATTGSIDITSGGAASNVTVSGGNFTVGSGGTVSGLTVSGYTYDVNESDASGAITGQYVASLGGVASLQAGAVASGGTEVNSLGALYVADHASGITVSVGGQVIVLAGGVTTGTNLVGDFASNGYETVYGTASGSVLGNDGVEIVAAGGVAVRTEDVQGQIDVTGGTIISAVLSATGIANVSAGIASATQLITASGEQVVDAGGTARGTFIDKGTEAVDGGTASGSYTGESGFEVVDSGGTTMRDIISGFQARETVFSGTAISTQLSDQATMQVYAGGSSVSATLSGGAEEYLYGGVDSGSVIGNSGLLYVEGAAALASGNRILSGGEANVQDDGTLSGAVVSAGGLAVFTTGGVGSNVTILSGGTAIADTTGILNGLVVSNGGTLILSAASEFANITGVVSAGGVVELGGITVAAGTSQSVPGVQTVAVASGGLALNAGARLDDITPDIQNGAVLSVGSGGAVYSPELESGGTLVLAAGASAYGQAFAGGGGLIVDDGALIYEPLPSSALGPAQTQPGIDLDNAITGTGSVIFGGYASVTDSIDDTGTGNVTLGPDMALDLNNGEAAGTGEIVLGADDEVTFNYSPAGNVYPNAVADLTPGDTLEFNLTTNGEPIATLNGDVLNLADGNQYHVNLDLTGSSVGNDFTAVDDGGILEVLVQPLMVTGGYVVEDGDCATGLTVEAGGDAVVDAGGVATSPIIAGGTLELNTGSTVTGNISFSGVGRLVVDGSDPTNEIYGFAPGDSIKLTNVGYVPGDQVVVDTPGIVTIVTAGMDYEFNIAGATVGETGFEIGGDLLLTEDTLCFLRGTRILTPVGEIPVEYLRIGDEVVTRFGGIQPIRWIGRQNYEARLLRNNSGRRPVCIGAGALGPNRPARDLLVSPGHSLLLGESLVLASTLVNGVTIRQPRAADTAVIEYFQIELERHDCVIAEGAWAETYADAPGMRAQFHNAAEYEALYPDAPPAESLELCARRPEGGVRLEAALRPVVAIAAACAAPGALVGYVERVSAWQVEGWAMDQAHPELPVLLEVLAGDELLGTSLACLYRRDLAQAGLGRGRCAFSFTAPARLPAAEITVRRARDGARLAQAGVRSGNFAEHGRLLG